MDTPKIQTNESTEEAHLMYFTETDFRIPFSLWGMFSYFITNKPTAEEMIESEDIYLITPSRMNPHCDAYATCSIGTVICVPRKTEYRCYSQTYKKMLHWQRLYRILVWKQTQSTMCLRIMLNQMKRRIHDGSRSRERRIRYRVY